MTRLESIEMHNFKSFGGTTRIVLPHGLNCVIGPNGSGKCVVGGTLVAKHNGSVEKIKDMVERAFKEGSVKETNDGYIVYGGNDKVLCMDTGSLKLKSKPVLAYVKRKSPQFLVRIKTKTGRTVTATEYHPLFVFRNGRVECVKAEELKQGTRVAVPRKLNVHTESEVFTEFLNIIKKEDGLYVPYNEIFMKILAKSKQQTWKKTASKIGVPSNVIKGLKDKQAVNFAYLVKILRYCCLKDCEIIDLIPYVKAKNENKVCRFPWHNSPELSRFLGYFLAEGRLTVSSQIWFTNKNQEMLCDYACIAKKLFDVNPQIKEYKPDCYDVLIYSKPLITILSKLAVGDSELPSTSANKCLSPVYLKHATEDEIANLLSGLYSGDGYIAKNGNQIEITTKSSNLACLIEHMLLRLGIICHSKSVVKIATNSGFSGVYRTITVYSQESINLFREKIKLVHQGKQNRLDRYKLTKINACIDLIEVNSLVKDTADELGINVKNTKKDFPRLDSYCYNQCTPSRDGLKYLINGLFNPISNGRTLSLEKLKLLADSDILWDEITSIERVKSEEEWVYDLCIEKHHNFVANNFFVHNSNIIDAMIFVLGALSKKELRTEKLQHLICHGGKKKTPAKEAKVAVILTNENNEMPIDTKKVEIARVIHSDGTSEYLVNGNTVTRFQVISLLHSIGLDPNGHNIILQGTIEHFVEMNSEERRKIVEEISGISVYEDKKKSAMSELRQVETKLREANIVLRERERYLKELEHEKQQAEKYYQLQERLKFKKAGLLKKGIEKEELKIQEIEKKIAVLENKLKDFNQKEDYFEQKSKELKDNLEALNKGIELKGEKEQIRIRKEIMSLREKKIQIENLIKSHKKEKSAIEERFEASKKQIEDNKREILKLKAEKKELERGIAENEKILADDKKKLNMAKYGQQELFRIKKELLEAERKKEKAETKQELEKRLKKINEETDEKKSKREKIDGYLKNLYDLNDKIKSSLKHLDTELTSVNEELVRVNIARQTATSNLWKGSQEILRQRDENKIIGIHGAVSELAKVPDEYSKALKTAVGAKINYIVVENEDVAIACIEHLKKTKKGYATLIPLTKLREKKTASAEIPKIPEVIGLAKDIIKYDKKYELLFRSLLGNAIIIKDLQASKKINVPVNMATIDGDLITSAGTYSGGYKREIETVGFSTEEIEKKAVLLEGHKNELLKALAELKKEEEKNKEELMEAGNKFAVVRTEFNSVEEKKSEIQQMISRLGVQESVSEIEKQMQKLNSELEEFKKGIKRIPEQELKKLEESVSALDEKLRQKSISLTSVSSRLEILEPEIEKLAKIIDNDKKQKSEFEAEIEKSEKQLKQTEKELEQMEKEEKKFEGKFDDLVAKRKTLREAIEKMYQDEEKVEDSGRKIQDAINTIKVEKAGIVSRKEGLLERFMEFRGIELGEVTLTANVLEQQIKQLEERIQDFGGINEKAFEAFKNIEVEFNETEKQVKKVEEERDNVLKMIEEIESKKKDTFMDTFDKINAHFQNIFSVLSPGGMAELVIENKENPLEEGAGIEIMAKPRGKRMFTTRSMSGGEKTLIAIAFIFSIQEFNPAPFYILDEIDAALDKENSLMLADLLFEYSKKAQFIIISHNDSVYAKCDNLFGVSMNSDGLSQVVGIKLPF